MAGVEKGSKKWTRECRPLSSVAGGMPGRVGWRTLPWWVGTCSVSERRLTACCRGYAHDIRWSLFIHGQSTKITRLFWQMHNFSDSVRSMAGGWSAGAEADWGTVTTESLLFEIIFILVFLFFFLCLSLLCQSESPQIVLLWAGAFPQGDVIHGHLAYPASPTLPLQDNLLNNNTVHIEERSSHCCSVEMLLWFISY